VARTSVRGCAWASAWVAPSGLPYAVDDELSSSSSAASSPGRPSPPAAAAHTRSSSSSACASASDGQHRATSLRMSAWSAEARAPPPAAASAEPSIAHDGREPTRTATPEPAPEPRRTAVLTPGCPGAMPWTAAARAGTGLQRRDPPISVPGEEQPRCRKGRGGRPGSGPENDAERGLRG
jgi:hypothetical protein